MRVVFNMKQISKKEKDSLFKELKQGSHTAHRKIYKEYADEILRYIRTYYLFDPVSAEDILQEVFITAYIKISSLRDIYKLRVWLYRIASRKCINSIKKNRQEQKVQEEYGRQARKSVQSTEDQVIEMDLLRIITGEVCQLPDFLREVFILREYQKLKYEEIASITEATLSRVKKAMKKAMSKLLKDLEKKEISKYLLLK